MKFRKVVCRRNGFDVVVFLILIEEVNLIFCLKFEGQSYYSLKCFIRECSECGVSKFEFFFEEVLEGFMEEVTWKRYEYVGIGKFLFNGQEKKKIAFVIKMILLREFF